MMAQSSAEIHKEFAELVSSTKLKIRSGPVNVRWVLQKIELMQHSHNLLFLRMLDFENQIKNLQRKLTICKICRLKHTAKHCVTKPRQNPKNIIRRKSLPRKAKAIRKYKN